MADLDLPLPPELLLLIVGACVLAALLLIAWRLWTGSSGVEDALAEADRRQADTAERLARSQAELAGRMAQIAESQAAAQARMAEQLQAQERELARKLEERLADVTKRVGDSLEKSSQTTQTTITDLKERLAVIDSAQQNITALSTQVVGLQDILANKQARGAFGEIQLNDLVMQALPPSAYAFQATLTSGRRVDCLLTLPNPPGAIAIDAKFPLEPYQALREAGTDAERDAARRLLAQAIGKHVKDIAERYIVPGETADSALMFLPSEAVYAELHANLAAVVQDAFRRRVWIVSPTTLMATLNTVRAVLKDARISEQAGLLQAEVGRLLDDVRRLDDRVGKLQNHFRQADEDMRQIRISTEKIDKRAERIREVEVEEPERVSAAPDRPRLVGSE
ncbi:DNA recombination protein RmuC [Thalassobaculum fulvum]|uniref:DNA recombination protein RmuC homolog n=1 Tax=Thalassobaculum fulvum TaxID=1633335 RepID=A0A919CQU2_9PROT|nr:DNA recombination protein RmuC [Thalassobaculum fulvum]GHD56580.1 DNA recombination protein RmuC [Thalassobaculum fulvum]